MSIEDFITQKVKQNGAKVRITQYLDVDGYAKEVASEVDEQLLHAVATMHGYVKERTCHAVGRDLKPYDPDPEHSLLDAACDQCGGYLGGRDTDHVGEYCRDCGAKVVGR